MSVGVRAVTDDFDTAVQAGERVLPAYDGGSIVNVPASILAAFDVEPASAPLRADLVDAQMLRQAPGGVACLVVDALGLQQLQTGLATGRMPRLARVIEQTGAPRQLTSVFPSTTTVALTSLATGEPPAVHGILGHVLWLDAVDAVCSVLHFAPVGRPDEPIDDDLLHRRRTIHQRLGEAGVASYAVTAAQYEGTAFTDMLQRGSRFLGYQTQSQIPVLLERALSESSGDRCHVTLYWPHVDTIAHTDGPDASQPESIASAVELEFVDLMIAHVVETCRRHRCALMITADHGQTALDPDRACLLPDPLINRLRHRPTGGRRAAYFACDDGALLRDSIVSDVSDLVSVDDVVDAGWFGGALAAGDRSRIGDWIALAHDGVQFLIDDGDGVFPQRGGHAGLTPAEMDVPLIVVPAE